MKTMQDLKNITLEVSLKPFADTSPAGFRRTARQIFTQWSALIRHAEQVSIMLWTADGSEILDYSGELEQTFDWARYMGCCNENRGPLIESGPGKPVSLNSGYYLYQKNPPSYTYRKLQKLVAILRETGQEMTSKAVRIGATFDPGPEFANSAFKYKHHPEINISYEMRGKYWFLCCYSILHADSQIYAGYPQGIPEGTPIGTFLGRQSRHFLNDLGFDFLWLSNGLGFGLEPWKCTGELFDGSQFFPEKAQKARQDIHNFWTQFRRECPDIRIETRGTNMGVGIDIATDGISFKDLYNGGFNFQPPPNSPWAAIDGDFGLELTGYMSRIAELPPAESYPFRFYSHDPWWMNSPWIDRYERQPHDIYMPLALSRIDQSGQVRCPTSLNFLSIDNTLGQMPDCVPDEITPHMIRAFAEKPDAPAPLVWVYPFDEYDQLGKLGEQLAKMYFEDWYMRSAVNQGLPLSSVISTGNFVAVQKTDPVLLKGSLMLTPVPVEGSTAETALIQFVKSGGNVLFYGSVERASIEIMHFLGLGRKEALSGEFSLEYAGLSADKLISPCPERFFHDPLISDGGITAVPDSSSDDFARILAWAVKGAERRAIASARSQADWNGGKAVWLRGTSSNVVSPKKSLPKPHDPAEYFPMESLARLALTQFGYHLIFSKSLPGQRDPAFMVHRNENSFIFSGFSPDTTVEIALRFPLGAPLLLGSEAQIRDGCAVYRMPRAWHHECRVFVDQADGLAPVSCIEDTPEDNLYRRHLRVQGLKQATVYIFPYPGFEQRILLKSGPERNNSDLPGDTLDEVYTETPYGPAWKCTNVTGSLNYYTELADDILW